MEPKTDPCQFEIDLKYDYDLQEWFPGAHKNEEINWAPGHPDIDDVLILKFVLTFQNSPVTFQLGTSK